MLPALDPRACRFLISGLPALDLRAFSISEERAVCRRSGDLFEVGDCGWGRGIMPRRGERRRGAGLGVGDPLRKTGLGTERGVLSHGPKGTEHCSTGGVGAKKEKIKKMGQTNLTSLLESST